MRISRHQMFMGIAELAARRATCFRRSVGAILVQDNNVVSIGYNGPPAGELHCTGSSCPTNSICTRSVHAEKNVFDRLQQRTGLLTLYVTESPCPDCTELILQNAVTAVYYLNEYRIKDGLDTLKRCAVDVFRMTPSGMVINYATGELHDQ